MAQRDDMREIREELRRLRSRLQMRPIITKEGGGSAAGPTLIRIRKGNKIAEYGATPTKVYGMKYTAGTSITDILAAEHDGTAPETGSGMDEGYQNGLCWGTIVDTEVDVFVANKATPLGGTAQTDVTVNYALPENAFVYCLRSVQVPLITDDDTLFPVYLTWRV